MQNTVTKKKLHEIVEKLVLHFINENEWPAATPHDTMVRDVEDFVRGNSLSACMPEISSNPMFCKCTETVSLHATRQMSSTSTCGA